MNAALALFTSCLLSGIVVPVPEDVPLLLAGLAVARGDLSLSAAVLAGGLGTLGRDALVFGVGRLAGPGLRALLERRPRIARTIGHLESRTPRQREGVVFLTRFAVGARAPLFFVAGLLDVSLGRFLLLDLAGMAITLPACLWAGHQHGEAAVSLLESMLAHQRPALVALAVGAGIGWLARGWRKRRARG